MKEMIFQVDISEKTKKAKKEKYAKIKLNKNETKLNKT
jgi:hypothetical protein